MTEPVPVVLEPGSHSRRASRADPALPLSSSQRGLWVSQRRHQEAPLQNMAQIWHLGGAIDPAKLAAAFRKVVRESDVLRARFVEVNGSPRMHVVSAPDSATEIIDLDRSEASSWAAERASRPMDISRQVIDSVILRHEDETVSWFLNLHHLVTDATATALVVEATASAYVGDAPSSSFAAWHSATMAAETDPTRDRARAHWAGRAGPPALPGLYQPVRHPVTASERRPVDLSDQWMARANERLASDYRMLSEDLGWTVLLLSATAEYLHLVTGSTDFAIGVPVHNRADESAQDVIGPLMEVYPVDVTIVPGDSHRSLHKRVARSLLTTLRHAGPEVGQPGDGGAIVNVITRAGHGDFAGHQITSEWVHPGASDPQHLVRVQLTAFGRGELGLALDLNHGGADAEHRSRAPGHFQAVLDAMVDDPDAAVDTVSLVRSGSDEAADLERWGSGATSSEATPIVPRLRAALASDDRVVLTDPDRPASTMWTGRELWNWSGVLVDWLMAQGVAGGERIGLELDRSADAVAVMLACLRAGISYVPIDPAQPEARRVRLAERAGCRLVVRDVPVDLDLSHGCDPSDPVPADEAYLLFTSGSTGEPKGVPVAHDGLSRYLEFATASYVDPAEPPVAPLFSALTFDLTVTSIFVPLLSGGRVVVVRPSGIPGLQRIASSVELNWLKATPSHLEVLLQLLSVEGLDEHSLRRLVVGGEAFSMRLARKLRSTLPDLEIFNEYGPTEAVVGCMIHRVVDEDLESDETEVPIGVPADDVTLRIVDQAGHRVPIGVTGELVISSPSLTAGYLDPPAAEADPFISIDGERGYRSGDLIRLIDGDRAVYQGRVDEQIKVGGIRLEPAEVEDALEDHPSIHRAAVRLWTPSVPAELFHCARCGLPSNVPGTRFDDDGICNSCHEYDAIKVQAESWFRDLDDLREVRDRARSRRTGAHDAVALLSGGKDSTYMLYQLVEQGFDVFALTLDNGFISDGAKENVRRSVAELGIEHEFMTSDVMNEIFRDSLERFSNVCHGCYKVLYTLATTRAVDIGAPLVVTGLSRGQLFETRLIPQQFESGRFDSEAIDRAVIEARKAYHRADDPTNRLLDTTVFESDDLFDRVEFVDFYRYIDVELSEMLHYLDTQAPWVRPADTGRSTNCLVNAAGIHTHLSEQGYHNYAMPYAWDVRLGHKQRREAMDELDDQLDLEEIGGMLRQIDYEPQPRAVLSAWFETVVDQTRPTPAELRSFLSDRLAGHQVPAAFMAVDSLPITTNGKLDEASLPAPDRIHRAGPSVYVSPTSALETTIVAVWERVLGVEPIGLDDDFFALGGDSLAALEMVVALSEIIGATIREDLAFNHTTARQLALVLEDSHSAIGEEAGPTATPDGVAPVLSPAETGLLFEYRNRTDRAAYNVARRYTIDGTLDVGRLEVAIRDVVDRNPSLHWTFSEPRTRLTAEAALDFEDYAEPMPLGEVARRVDALHGTEFDVDKGPLVRARVHRLDDGRTSVSILTHHLSADDQSFALIWTEIEARYRSLELPDRSVDPGGHGTWQSERAGGDSAAYWADQWTAPAITEFGFEELSTVPDGASRDSTVGDGYVSLPSTVTADELIAGPGTTPFATAFAALAAVMDRYGADVEARSGGSRVGIGVTSSVRDHGAVESSIGYFINTIPVVVEWDHGSTGADLGTHASERLTAAVPHRSYPYVRMLTDARSEGRPVPGVSVLLAYEDLVPAHFDGMAASYEILSNDHAVVDATIFVQRRGDAIELGMEYRGSTIGRDRATQILTDLDAVLIQLIDSPHRAIDDFELPSAAGSVLDGPPATDFSLFDRILARSGADPDAPAVRCGDDRLDWRSLDAQSRSLADALRSEGVAPGDRVAVALDRSVHLVTSLLAVLRCGAVYVPVDPSYPEDRIAQIVQGTEPAMVVSDDPTRWSSLPVIDPVVAVREVVTVAAAGSTASNGWRPAKTDPAYVIFTSGSTGVPRGVEVTHGALEASTGARFDFYDDHPGRFLLASSIGFDSSIAGLFWTLANGGELVIPTPREAHDPDGLLALIDQAAVSHTLMVPTLYGALLDRAHQDQHWPRSVVVAGEACPPELVERHHESRPESLLTNEYGPTEATVWSTAHHCTSADGELVAVPIGRPIPGVRNAVLDSRRRPVPVGVGGELAVGGPGVVSGYLDDRAATADRFVESSLGRLYRTGDRSLVNDGRIFFRGRVDDQLNVGGVRVEPDEIERLLVSFPGVSAAVVVAVDRRSTDELLDSLDPAKAARLLAEAAGHADPALRLRSLLEEGSSGARQLIAQVEAAEDIDIEPLHELVVRALPSSSRPVRYGVHRRLPRTAHGKLDRSLALGLRADRRPAARPAPLPSSAGPEEHRDAVDPGAIDEVLRIFRTELGPDLGPEDDFFQFGGDSLAALTVAVAVEERFDRPFAVTKLIENSTARAVAALVAGIESDAVDETAPGPTVKVVPTRDGGLLASLRPGTDHSRPAVLLVAPGTGHLMTYQPLASALDPSLDVYGFSLPGADGRRPPLHSVGEIVDEMLQEWELLDGRPVVMLGGSSGGLLAWELAVRLQDQERQADALILQDTLHPQAWRDTPPPTRAEAYRTMLAEHGIAGTLKETVARGRRRLEHMRAMRAMKTGGATAPPSPEAISHHLVMATDEMTMAYDPGRLDQSVRFFAASNTDPVLTIDRWGPICNELRIDHLEGDHHGDDGIGSPRRVGVAARLVEDEVARVERG